MFKQRFRFAFLLSCFAAASIPGVLHSQESPHQNAEYIATISPSNGVGEPAWLIDLHSPHFQHADVAKLDCKVCHLEQPDSEQAAFAWAYAYAQEDLSNAPAPGQQVGRYVVANLVDDILRSHLQLGEQPVLTVLASHAVTEEEEVSAALQRGDLILASEELALTDTVAFADQCEKTGRTTIELTIIRAGERQKVSVPSIQLQSRKPPFQFGVQVEDASEVLRTQLGLYENEGIVVTDVVEGSAAEEAGVQVHDILLRADGTRLSTLGNLREAAQLSMGKSVTLVLIRGGKEKPLQVQPKRAEFAAVADPCPALTSAQFTPWHAYQLEPTATASEFNRAYLNSLYGTVKAALKAPEENAQEISYGQPAPADKP
ncbi:MAG: PDZ domain-containing protein [Planctomycetota bacterium]